MLLLRDAGGVRVNAAPVLALNLFGDNRTPPWEDTWPERRMTSAEYAAYVRSPGWRWKSYQVMLRCRYMCEWTGCNAPAVHVHHLTYENLRHEPLTDLMAVCLKHHGNAHYDRARPPKSRLRVTSLPGVWMSPVHQARKRPPQHILYKQIMREKNPA
jgi:hypothetical protein